MVFVVGGNSGGTRGSDTSRTTAMWVKQLNICDRFREKGPSAYYKNCYRMPYV